MTIRVAGADCVLVPDCAQYQGALDFSKLEQSWHHDYWFADEKLIILKLTEGNGYVDPFAVGNCQAAASHGWATVGYHYARPDRNRDDAVAEARHFAHHLEANGCRAGMLDFEEASLSAAELATWRRQFIDELYRLLPAPHGLYEGAYLPVAADPQLEARVWLCVPNYRAGYTPDPDPRQFTSWPPLPPGFSKLALWQYTSSAHVPGIGGSSVDMSVATKAWADLIHGGTTPQEDDMPPYRDWDDADRRALAADVRGEIVGEPADPNQDYGSVTLKSLAELQAKQFQALAQLVADATGKTLTWDQGKPVLS